MRASLQVGTKGVAAGPTLVVVEDFGIQLLAQLSPGDSAGSTAGQTTEDGPGQGTQANPHRPGESTDSSTGLGAPKGTGSARGGSRRSARGTGHLAADIACDDVMRGSVPSSGVTAGEATAAFADCYAASS